MTDAERTTSSDDAFVRGLADVLDSARQLATQLRGAARGVGQLGERELAMIIGTGEDVRDRVISEELMAKARQDPLVASLRQTAHRGLDLGFDAMAVGVQAGSDLLDTVLRTTPAHQELAGA